MNILFLAIGSNIDINKQDIYTDFIRYMSKQGHDVSFAYSYEKRLNKNTMLETVNGIHCLGVKIGNVTKTNFIEKGISLITLEKKFLKAIKKNFHNKEFDLILYATPPITFEKVIKYIKKRDNAISYLLLKDIFPQNAVDLEMFSSKGLLFKYFRKKEIKLYKRADYIGCMSQANIDYILKENDFIDKSKVHVNPNTLTPLDVTLSSNEITLIRRKYNLPTDKRVFLYGGNFGKPQGVDFLLQCILSNEQRDNSFMLIIGKGTESNKIIEFFKKNEIKNSLHLDYIDNDDYIKLTSACDVGMIFLDNRFTIPNFPSRVLSYMQSGLPIISAIDKNTDFGTTIVNGKFGWSSISGDLNHFNNNVNEILSLSNDEFNVYKSNSRSYLENNYTSKIAYEIMMRNIEYINKGD